MARRPATLDASDPRMPLGVFHLCGCGQRVIPAWEQACPGCRAAAPKREVVAAAHAVSRPPPPPPLPAHVPTGSGSLPRPTALHTLAPPPPPQGVPAGPPPAPSSGLPAATDGRRGAAPAQPPDAPRRTVRLDLAPLRGTPVAPPAPPSAAPKRTVMLSLPTPRPEAADLVLAWAPAHAVEPEAWTLERVAADGTQTTLYLRWHGGRWHVLDDSGAEADAPTLHALGITLRSGRP